MIGLVDCNNFFVSCERVFRPTLRHSPVVVLSNNDGCIVSRSNEAKAMGLKMGTPFYQVRHLVEEGRLFAFSSNLTLYGDMSRRVMSVIRGMVPRIEVYSIDETFIDLRGIANPDELGHDISIRVERWTGVPVSVGIASTKTLAKMASKYAKKYKGFRGCCMIDTEEKRRKALRLYDIKDVWGVGHRMSGRMADDGVHTAEDFIHWNRQRVQREFGITGVRTWLELQGERCFDFEPSVAKRSIVTSRSFQEAVTDFEKLRALVVDFATLCARKLREQHGYASTLVVFTRTNPFRTDLPQYSNYAKVEFPVPTSDLRELAAAATAGLRSIFKSGYAYKQAGVEVLNIANGALQTSIFDKVDRVRQEKLLNSIDGLRKKMGDRVVQVAAQENSVNAASRKYRSGCYTTNVDDVIQVKIT